MSVLFVLFDQQLNAARLARGFQGEEDDMPLDSMEVLDSLIKEERPDAGARRTEVSNFVASMGGELTNG